MEKEFYIEGSPNEAIDCKRLYLEGVKAFSKCPTCQKVDEVDFKRDYLSYPVANSEVPIYFYCQYCDAEWQKKAKFNVSLEALEGD